MSVDLSADIIDVRDILYRVGNLEASIDYCREFSEIDQDESDELDMLRSLLGELAGNGGDEQFEGEWYPVTLIRDSYFKRYAQELADDIGAVPSDYTWPTSCIDWDQAARELQMDYTPVETSGATYWYR